MDKEDKKTLSEVTPTEEVQEEKVEQTETVEKVSPSQDELDRIASKVRAEEKAKAEKAIAEARKEAKAEAERLAKLSQDEREKEESARRENEYADREKRIRVGENKLVAIDLLTESNVKARPEVIGMLTTDDESTTRNNVEAYIKNLREDVEREVANQLSGKPPKDVAEESNKKTEKVMPTVW